MPDTSVEITKDDTVCHWVFDPKHFSDTTPSCLDLDVKVFFTSRSAHPYHMSVNSKNLCEEYPDDVNKSGQEQAGVLSEKNKERGRDYDEQYVGFIKADVSDVENIQYEDHSLVVEHAPTDHNYTHCNIVLKFPTSKSKPASSKRNLMADDLKECFGDDVETLQST